MLPGKRDFYRCCKARRSASHVNKEFWQQFQNYAPPSLRVIRTNFARTIIYIYAILNWTDLRVSRSLRSLANYYYILWYVQNFVLITRKEGGASFWNCCQNSLFTCEALRPALSAEVKISLPRQHFSSRILLDRKLSESYFFWLWIKQREKRSLRNEKLKANRAS